MYKFGRPSLSGRFHQTSSPTDQSSRRQWAPAAVGPRLSCLVADFSGFQTYEFGNHRESQIYLPAWQWSPSRWPFRPEYRWPMVPHNINGHTPRQVKNPSKMVWLYPIRNQWPCSWTSVSMLVHGPFPGWSVAIFRRSSVAVFLSTLVAIWPCRNPSNVRSTQHTL